MIRKDEYAIVGLGVTKTGKVPGISPHKFEAEACRLAIEDAGLTREDIDGYMSEMPPSYWAPGPVEDCPPRMLGLPLKLYWSLQTGGGATIAQIATAMGALDAGLVNYVAIAFGDNPYSMLRSGRLARYFEPLRRVSAAYGDAQAVMQMAPLARAHMARYGTTSRQLGAITVAERQYAAVNLEAFFYGKPITIEDHQKSSMVADPLRVLDCCIITDGGAAIIITTADRAKYCKSNPVYIKGIGMGHDLKMIAEGRTKDTFLETEANTAKEKAFKMAGVQLNDIDVAEVYDAFTIVALLQIEDYGFCKKGEGGPFVESGNMGLDAKCPINTSGGHLACNYMAGFTPLIEAIRQVRKERGEGQIKDVELAMATGFGQLFPMMFSYGHPVACCQACIVLGCSKG